MLCDSHLVLNFIFPGHVRGLGVYVHVLELNSEPPDLQVLFPLPYCNLSIYLFSVQHIASRSII